MSVTYATGFMSAGVKAGLKNSDKLDFAVVKNCGPEYNFAGTWTPNRFAAAPVKYSKNVAIRSSNKCQYVIINSGSANACTGSKGDKQVIDTAQYFSDKFDVENINQVQICSTGKIGVLLNMSAIENGINLAFSELSDSNYNNTQAGINAANAILTTDTVSKTAQRSYTRNEKEWRIGGMVKGAGMIAPQMATMICVITTDAIVDNATLQTLTKKAVNYSFNRIDSDGCMSTNDTVLVLSNGNSGISPNEDDFYEALLDVMKDLASQIISDAEGATHDILIKVNGANSQNAGLAVAKEIARSNLLKCALFGGDPNWGRVLASIGIVQEEIAPFDPNNVSVTLNGVRVFHKGELDKDSKTIDLKKNRLITIEVDLNSGDECVEVLTNDLTYEYVEVNAEYST